MPGCCILEITCGMLFCECADDEDEPPRRRRRTDAADRAAVGDDDDDMGWAVRYPGFGNQDLSWEACFLCHA